MQVINKVLIFFSPKDVLLHANTFSISTSLSLKKKKKKKKKELYGGKIFFSI